MLTSTTNLSKPELINFRNAVTATIDIYQDQLESLILNENPLPREVADAKLQITRLLNIQNTLTTLISQEIITDLEDAGARISNTTEKLKKAMAKLNKLNKILGIIGSFIKVANAIISAMTGSSAVAGIAGIVNTLNSLIDDAINQE